MRDVVLPDFARFIGAERLAGRLAKLSTNPIPAGKACEPVLVDATNASAMLRVSAQRSAGLCRDAKRTEVVWVDGDRELAVNLAGLQVKLGNGTIQLAIPVCCDQTGGVIIEVLFVVGSPDRPTGMYASTYRRPEGPEVIVNAWGEALVAFAWQCVLGLVSGIAGAVGKDARGNVLVPAEMTVSTRGIAIVSMARHRFSNSSGVGTIQTKV
jgi:hypothetical protein